MFLSRSSAEWGASLTSHKLSDVRSSSGSNGGDGGGDASEDEDAILAAKPLSMTKTLKDAARSLALDQHLFGDANFRCEPSQVRRRRNPSPYPSPASTRFPFATRTHLVTTPNSRGARASSGALPTP